VRRLEDIADTESRNETRSLSLMSALRVNSGTVFKVVGTPSEALASVIARSAALRNAPVSQQSISMSTSGVGENFCKRISLCTRTNYFFYNQLSECRKNC
jgi:hypothetical protein